MLPMLSQAETFDIVQTAVDEDEQILPMQTKWNASSLKKSMREKPWQQESSLPTERQSDTDAGRASLPAAG